MDLGICLWIDTKEAVIQAENKAPAIIIYNTLSAGASAKSEITEKEENNMFSVHKQLCP